MLKKSSLSHLVRDAAFFDRERERKKDHEVPYFGMAVRNGRITPRRQKARRLMKRRHEKSLVVCAAPAPAPTPAAKPSSSKLFQDADRACRCRRLIVGFITAAAWRDSSSTPSPAWLAGCAGLYAIHFYAALSRQ
jgi:hypothetical protein